MYNSDGEPSLLKKSIDKFQGDIVKKTQAAVTSSFLNTISHEIFTPLNAIIGMTELLLNSELSQKQLKHAKTIRKFTEHLSNTLKNLLDISLLETGQLQIFPLEFELQTLIEEVTAYFKPLAEEKKLNLQIEYSTIKNTKFIGDAMRIKQILGILISNAIKFTQQGSIRIIIVEKEVTTKKVVIHFEVQDTGIGISKNIKDRLFTRFVQGDMGNARKYGGLGIGLALAKQLVEMMEGHIDFVTKESNGCTIWFELTLPIANGVLS